MENGGLNELRLTRFGGRIDCLLEIGDLVIEDSENE